jgi:hypothetical protein
MVIYSVIVMYNSTSREMNRAKEGMNLGE